MQKKYWPSRSRRKAGAVLLAPLFWLVAASAMAQIVASTSGVGGPALASDDVPQGRTIPLAQQVKDDMARSRLTLGPLRLLPAINVTNAGYDSNVFGTSENPVGDWTATVSAGVKLLVPFGSKVYFVGDAFPQYTWYDKLSDRDQFGGVYDAALLGFFNHLTAELMSSYTQTYQVYSTEVDSLVFQTGTNAVARVEFDLSANWSLFGQGAYEKVDYIQKQGPPSQDVGVRLNNRTETGGRGGFRYHITPDWNVAVAVEGTSADFDITPALRNSASMAYLGSVQYNRPRLFLNLVGGYRQGTGTDGAFFPDYNTGVGSFFLSWFPIRWLEIQGNGHRKVVYSTTVFSPYYFENRLGGRVNIQVAPRALLSGYFSYGPNDYPRAQPVGDTLVKRRDESKEYGGGLSVLVWRQLVFSAQGTRSIYNSNIPGDSRAYTRYTAMLSLSGELQR